MDAPRVVTSTIQPMAVLPRKGMRAETATTAKVALPGTPCLFSFASASGASPSLAAANSRRLKASRFPIRLVRITPNSASISTVTPKRPR